MNERKSFYDVASFYANKAVLAASYNGMRYRVERGENEGEEVLLATVWPEPYCYERTPEEKKERQFFVFTDAGLDEAYEWICGRYTERENEWNKVKAIYESKGR